MENTCQIPLIQEIPSAGTDYSYRRETVSLLISLYRHLGHGAEIAAIVLLILLQRKTVPCILSVVKINRLFSTSFKYT
jgi:hypothetical protein